MRNKERPSIHFQYPLIPELGATRGQPERRQGGTLDKSPVQIHIGSEVDPLSVGLAVNQWTLGAGEVCVPTAFGSPHCLDGISKPNDS